MSRGFFMPFCGHLTAAPCACKGHCTKLLAAPALPVHRSHRRTALACLHRTTQASSSAAVPCAPFAATTSMQCNGTSFLPKLAPSLSLSFPAGRSRPHLSQNDTLKCRQTHVPATARHLSIPASSGRFAAIQSLPPPSLRSAALCLYIGRSPMRAIT